MNKEQNDNIVELDIWTIQDDYKDRFNHLLNQCSKSIRYKGIIDYNCTTEIIKSYYLLLFPTQYYTEVSRYSFGCIFKWSTSISITLGIMGDIIKKNNRMHI